jgi:hypothetical protein
MLCNSSKITRKIIVLSKAFDETSRHGLSYLTSKLNSRAPRKLSGLVGGEESRSARLAQMVAATVPLGRLVFPAKAVERSHWCGDLEAQSPSLAIAPWHQRGANDAEATAFFGRPVAPFGL